MATATGSYVTAALMKARAGITDSSDDTVIGSICDQVNSWIERTTGRIIAPVTSATYTFNGDGTRRLYIAQSGDGSPTGGLRAVSLVEVATYTSAGYATLASTQYFLQERAYPGGPYDALHLTDHPTSFVSSWPSGYATVRVTATAGPSAIPDDVAEVAATIAIRAWGARLAGQNDIVGTDMQGAPVISRYVAGRDRDTLRAYTLAGMLV